MASLDVIWPGDACVDRLKKTDVYAVKQVYVKDFLWFFIQMIFDYILMFYVIFSRFGSTSGTILETRG